MAGTIQRRREAAEASGASGSSSATPRFTKFDMTALIIAEGLQTPAAVMSHVQLQGSVAMQAYTIRHQRKWQEFIDDAWSWHSAPSDAALETLSDWELVRRCAGMFTILIGCLSGGGAAFSAFFSLGSL